MKIRERVRLSNYTTIRIGGEAAYFVEVTNREDIENAIKFAHSLCLPYFVLGGGSNLLIDDKDLNIVIIKPIFDEISISGTKVEVGSSFKLPRLVHILLEEELSGLEELAEIPGEVGGAVFMNAGSYGREIGELVEEIEVFDGHEFLTIKGKDIGFNYRKSGIKPGWIITKIHLELTRGNKFRMTRLVAEVRRKRRETQPVGEKTFGSTFKNPESTSAGLLIDKAGLKGYRINDAEVSQKHANFIINRGNATFKDVVALMKYIQRRVKDIYGISLEPEGVILKGEQNG